MSYTYTNLEKKPMFNPDRSQTFPFDDFKDFGNLIDVQHPIRQIVFSSIKAVHGIKITYQLTDGTTKVVLHGEEIEGATHVVDFGPNEILYEIRGHDVIRPNGTVQILRLLMWIQDKVTGKMRDVGWFGFLGSRGESGGKEEERHVWGPMIAFAGHATSDPSFTTLDPADHGKHGGLTSLSFYRYDIAPDLSGVKLEESPWRLENVGTKTFVDLAGKFTDEGGWFIGWQHNNMKQQEWKFEVLPGENQYHILTNLDPATPTYASVTSDNFIVGSKTAKAWTMEPVDKRPSTYSIVDAITGLAWNLPNAENKTRIQLVSREVASSTQMWSRVAPPIDA